VVLKLDHGQISFRLVENALVTRQLAVVATQSLLRHFGPGMRRNQNFERPTALGFSSFDFFSFSFLPLGFLFAAEINLLPGLLGVKKGFRKSHQGGQFLPWSS